ncbi:MAG: GNAT family N-acetyltransferase [Cohaesibacter sp.]|nr:GNAT family N-acetyltransferase [Cohaesibacter sp.]
MDAYSVRLATPKDAGSIAELKVLCWRQSYQGLVPDHVLSNLDAGTEEPHWRNWLGDEAAGLVAFVCFSGDRLVAYGLAGPMRNEDKPDHPLKVDAEIYALYVHPDHQRQGLGKCLMTEMVCALVDQGHRSLGLWVLGGNKKGEHFYEKLSGQAGPKYVEIRNNRIAFRERAYLWPDLKAFRARLTVKSV